MTRYRQGISATPLPFYPKAKNNECPENLGSRPKGIERAERELYSSYWHTYWHTYLEFGGDGRAKYFNCFRSAEVANYITINSGTTEIRAKLAYRLIDTGM
jgi:hypothetical protein